MTDDQKTWIMLLIAWGYGGLAALMTALQAWTPLAFICFSGLILGMWIATHRTKP